MIDQMNGPALVRAYNGLAALRNIDGVKRFSDAKTGRLRVQASLEIVQESHDVTLAEDGEVTSTARGGLASGAGTTPPQAPSLPASPSPEPARVSPGLARLRANLGEAGTEALRQQVLSDGDKSLVTAAKREDELPAHDRDTLPSDTPAANAPDITHVTRRDPASGFGAPGAAQAFADSYALKKVEAPAQVSPTEAPVEAPAQTAPAAATSPRPAAPARKSTGRAPAVADSDVILVQFADGYNPKRLVAAERFAKYRHKMAVSEYVAAIGGDKKQALRDIAWDTSKGWIKVVGASQAK